MKNILHLFKEFLYIINDRYSEVMCAKYGGSRLNDACTVCLADFVGLPTKVIQLTTFFLKKKSIFVQLLCRPPAGQLGTQLMSCV